MIKEATPFLGYYIYSESLSNLPKKEKLIINTVNQYSFCIAEKDAAFKEALIESDVLLPDGVAIVASVKFLEGKEIKKIAGADIFKHLMVELNENGGACFFLGSSEPTLEKIKNKLSRNYPKVRAGFYSPPYKPVFSKDESEGMINAVNGFQPDVLFVGMTAPKQEKWVHAHKNELDVPIVCAIGAVFDFYAGTVARPKQFWIDLGLEWFIRLYREPKRLWKRYLYYGPIFVFHILKHKWGYVKPGS